MDRLTGAEEERAGDVSEAARETNFVSTSFVPAPVPSELQSFVPAWAPSLPAKKSVPATLASELGSELAVPGLSSRSFIPPRCRPTSRAPGHGSAL